MTFRGSPLLIFLMFSSFTFSEDMAGYNLGEDEISYKANPNNPICLNPTKNGSVEQASGLGTLLTLGMNTVGKFRCAFFWRVDGTYEADCKELECRANNHLEIIERANELIKISNRVLKEKKIPSSSRTKIQQGIRKLESYSNYWKKTSGTNFNKANSVFLEQYLNYPLEDIIDKQINLLPVKAQKEFFDIFIRKYEERIEKERIAAEKWRIKQEAKEKRRRVEAEAAIRAEEEAYRKKVEEQRRIFKWVVIVFAIALVGWIIATISAEKRKKEEHERLEEEQKRIDAKFKKDLEALIKKTVKSYEKKYNEIYKSIEKDFSSLLQTISLEEEELINLKSRHPKIETIVSSRQIGDSNSNLTKEIKKLLSKLAI